MDKSKCEIYFHSSFGIKWHMHMHGQGNAVLSVQQKQRNVLPGHIIKVVAAVIDYALWLFFKWSLQADGLLAMILAMTMTFSPHSWREKAYIRCMIKGTWYLCFCRFSLLEKRSQKKLSLSLSSAYFDCWFKIILFRSHGIGVILSFNWKMFLSLITTALWVVLFLCEFISISVPVSGGFCRWLLCSKL